MAYRRTASCEVAFDGPLTQSALDTLATLIAQATQTPWSDADLLSLDPGKSIHIPHRFATPSCMAVFRFGIEVGLTMTWLMENNKGYTRVRHVHGGIPGLPHFPWHDASAKLVLTLSQAENPEARAWAALAHRTLASGKLRLDSAHAVLHHKTHAHTSAPAGLRGHAPAPSTP